MTSCHGPARRCCIAETFQCTHSPTEPILSVFGLQVEQLDQASRNSLQALEATRQEAAQHLRMAEDLQQAVADMSAQESKSPDELRVQASVAMENARSVNWIWGQGAHAELGMP